MKRFLIRRHPWIALVLLAAAVRLPLLFGLGTLWNDEAFSKHFAKLPLGEMISLLRFDAHPPLHATVLNLWMRVFGDSALAIRSLSLAFALAGIACFLLLARRLYGRKEAFLAGLLAAFSPLMAYYGADGRMYAMAFFLACLSGLFLWKIVGEGEERWCEAWMWATLALVLTHLTGALVVLGQALWLAAAPERRPAFGRLFTRFLVIGAVFVVWFLPFAAFKSATLGQEWQFRSSQEDLYAPLSLLYWVWLGQGKVLPFAAAAAGALVLAGLLRRPEKRPGWHVSKASGFLLAWFLAAFVPFLFFPNASPRYLIGAVPPFFLLLANGFLNAAKGKWLPLVAGAGLIAFLALPGLAVQYAARPYAWDKAAEWILKNRQAGDRVVFAWYADRLAIAELDDPRLAAVATGSDPWGSDPKVPELLVYGLYPFDDDLTDDERYVAHAGTLAVRAEDFERLAPAFKGAERVFLIPNFYLTLQDGGPADRALNAWLAKEGWVLSDLYPRQGRTPDVWLMTRGR